MNVSSLLTDATASDADAAVGAAMRSGLIPKILVKHSNKYAFDKGGSLRTLIFPDLYPFGLGGPDMQRRRRMTLAQHDKYVLSLSTRQFAQDDYYLLYAYDQSQLDEMWKSSFLQVRFKPHEVASINSATSEEVRLAFEHEENTIDARRRHRAPPERPELALGAVALQRGVKAVMSKLKLTPEEGYNQRDELTGLRIDDGDPTMTFTTNVDERKSFAGFTYCGAEYHINLDEAGYSDIIEKAKRAKVISNDPVACAMIFNNMIELIFQHLLGFDLKARKCLKDGGLFGFVKHVYGGVEVQQKNSLHAHFLIWLHGFPKTVAECLDRLKSEVERKNIEDVAGMMRTQSLVIKTDSATIPCPFCKSLGTLKAIPVTISCRCALPPKASWPELVTCDKCKKSQAPSNYLRYCIKYHRQKAGFGFLDRQSFKNQQDRLLSAPRPPPLPNSIGSQSEIARDRVRFLTDVSMMQLATQEHAASHHASCFIKGEECRATLPSDVVLEESCLDPSGNMIYQRSLGCQYINKHAAWLLYIARFNTDSEMLLAADNKGARVSYACSYNVKPQTAVTSAASIAASTISRRIEREVARAIPYAETTMSAVRINSIAYGITGKLELAETLVAYRMMFNNERSAITDCQFVKLYVVSSFVAANGGELTGQLRETEGVQ